MRTTLCALAVLLTILARPAAAQGPTIQYLDLPPGFTFTLSGVCSFDVLEQLLGNKEKLISFYDQDGNLTLQLINGVNKWRFTNLNNGKVLDINASGPGKLTLQPGDITRVEGGGVSFFTVTPGPGVPPDFPAFALTRGRTVAELDAFFNIVGVSVVNGTVQDICAMLR